MAVGDKPDFPPRIGQNEVRLGRFRRGVDPDHLVNAVKVKAALVYGVRCRRRWAVEGHDLHV